MLSQLLLQCEPHRHRHLLLIPRRRFLCLYRFFSEDKDVGLVIYTHPYLPTDCYLLIYQKWGLGSEKAHSHALFRN